MSHSSLFNETRPKAQQILAGAKTAFLEFGYEGTSVDLIAQRAQVSKRTVYMHFADKETLFAAFIDAECREQTGQIDRIADSEDAVEPALYHIAEHFIRFFVSPFLQGIYRVAVAESQRFPELGRVFYYSGPDFAVRRLSQFLARAVGRGELVIDDLDLAAQQFLELCRADLFQKVLFGVQKQVSDTEVERVSNAAVTTFLGIYHRK